MRRQLLLQRRQELGVVARERPAVATLEEYFVTVSKHERAETVPLRLEDPRIPRRQRVDAVRQHRQDRRINWQIHFCE